MLRFHKHLHINQGTIATATTTVLAGPIDISTFETFSLLFQNQNTSVGILNLDVQVAFDASANVNSDSAPNFVSIPTSSLPLPSATAIGGTALPTSSSYMTSAITNAWHWLRVLGGASAAGAGTFRVTVGGMTRR